MILELSIETLTHGGRGLGRHEGKAVFVPHTAPGDRVRCRVDKEKARYIEASLVELHEMSPLRRDPPCPHFGDCGGCQWQHLDDQAQASWKERLFAETLTRNDLVTADRLRPIRQAPDVWRYRNRAQFKCRQTRDGFVVGFYRTGSHYVVDIAECRLLRPEVQETLTHLRAWLPGAPCPETIPQVDVACGDDGRVVTIVHQLREGAALNRAWLTETVGSRPFDLCLQHGRKSSIELLKGDGRLDFRVSSDHDLQLGLSPGGFAQVNSEQNRALVAQVVSAADLTGTESVLELFCGMGNFSLPLAQGAAHLVGIEDYGPAITDARANADRNGVENAVFHAEDAGGAISRHRPETGFDLLVLDPPRTGCYNIMKEILVEQPARVIYVSCDPVTLARDLTPLVHDGYRIVSSKPFDLFPQTWHTESVTLLCRNDG